MTVATPIAPRPGWRQKVRGGLDLVTALPRAAVARAMITTSRASRFAGAYDSRAEAEAAIAAQGRVGYDAEGISEVSFDVMCRRAVWDYPILFWLARLLPDCPAVLDAGGHLGTKYIAFSGLLNLTDTEWTVYDLPGIIRAAKAAQAIGRAPESVKFVDRVQEAPKADILLGSGLLQYLDSPFPAFVDSLRHRPKYILLNKVALRDGPTLCTIERIGSARVPYMIRNSAGFRAEIAAMKYRVLDEWTIPDLSHVLPTHPWLGRTSSRGFVLARTECDVQAFDGKDGIQRNGWH